MAEEGAFVIANWMAGFGTEPTPERPADDACERQVVADSVEKVVFWFGALVLAVRFELENSASRRSCNVRRPPFPVMWLPGLPAYLQA
jgi:hypothetical protein